jgi:hypothetical protein
MTHTPDEALEGQPPSPAEKERTRQAVAQALEGSDLHVQDQPYELIITNPDNQDRGQLYVDYEGHVTLRRVAWDYLGQLKGFETDETEGTITRAHIMNALGGQE